MDREICHPTEFDFYLVAHAGLQGTSRPVHYRVLFDENQFGPDRLQDLCHRLCYLYCRATKSVSVVPPVYYAHLAASRARIYAGDDGSEASDAGNGAAQNPVAPNNEPASLAPNDQLKFRMFFV